MMCRVCVGLQQWAGGSGTWQLECDGLGAVQGWLAVLEQLLLHVTHGIST